MTCFAKGDGKTTVALVNHCRAHVTFGGSNNQTGELDPDQFACRDVGSATVNLPAIRYWGFTAPDPGLGHHTLAEFTFNTTFNDFDWYNISHVDAQNLPMQIVRRRHAEVPDAHLRRQPAGRLPGRRPVQEPGGRRHRLREPHAQRPSEPRRAVLRQVCPDAYSWSGDDANSVVACAGEDYVVVFCP